MTVNLQRSRRKGAKKSGLSKKPDFTRQFTRRSSSLRKKSKSKKSLGFVRPAVLDVAELLLRGCSVPQILSREGVTLEFVNSVRLSLVGVPVGFYRDCRFALDGAARYQLRYLAIRFWALTGARGAELRRLLFEYLEPYYHVQLRDMPLPSTLNAWLLGVYLERVSEDGTRCVFRPVRLPVDA